MTVNRSSPSRSQGTDRVSDATNRRSQATDPVWHATNRRSQGTDRVSDATNRRSQATDPVSHATNRRWQATDPVSHATNRRWQATDPVSHATNRHSQATDRVSDTTNRRSQATDHVSDATNRRSQATDRVSCVSERDPRPTRTEGEKQGGKEERRVPIRFSTPSFSLPPPLAVLSLSCSTTALGQLAGCRKNGVGRQDAKDAWAEAVRTPRFPLGGPGVLAVFSPRACPSERRSQLPTQNVNVVLSVTDPTCALMYVDQMPPMKKYSGATV